jgi:hypothetical protein
LSSQVNRALRAAVLASPLIQHKIDLFAAGLEYNAAAGISLVDSKQAFHQYRSNLNSFRPAEERIMNLQRGYEWISGGVYAMVNFSAQLFALGSASRRIPHKEWEIPIPEIDLPMRYAFDPGADVIVFLDTPDETHVRPSQQLSLQARSNITALCSFKFS